jgi:hypothetical protein
MVASRMKAANHMEICLSLGVRNSVPKLLLVNFSWLNLGRLLGSEMRGRVFPLFPDAVQRAAMHR